MQNASIFLLCCLHFRSRLSFFPTLSIDLFRDSVIFDEPLAAVGWLLGDTIVKVVWEVSLREIYEVLLLLLLEAEGFVVI